MVSATRRANNTRTTQRLREKKEESKIKLKKGDKENCWLILKDLFPSPESPSCRRDVAI